MSLIEIMSKIGKAEAGYKEALPKFFNDIKGTFEELIVDAESCGQEFKGLVEETISDAMDVVDALANGQIEVGDAMEALTRYQASLENYADAARLAVVSETKDALLKTILNVIHAGCYLIAGGLR